MFDFFPVSSKEFDGPVLVTGAGGCIGSWTLALLEHAGVEVHAFDLQIDTSDRLNQACLGGESYRKGFDVKKGHRACPPRGRAVHRQAR